MSEVDTGFEAQVQKLVSEIGYKPEKAREVVTKLGRCDPKIQDAFHSWMRGNEISDVEVHGYSVSTFVDEYGMTPVAALLTLDWLIREPEIASQAIDEGYDFVIS